jgi:glycosyltransferase involved in cell wall biosynthesis
MATTLALLIPHVGKGGAELAIELLLKNIDVQRFTIHVIAPAGQPLVTLARERGFQAHVLRFPTFAGTSVEVGSRRIFNPFATLYTLLLVWGTGLQIAHLLRLHRVEVLYTASMIAHLVGAVACRSRLTQTRVVCHLQDIVRDDLALGVGTKLVRAFFRSAVDFTIVPSQAVYESIQPNRRAQVIHYGIDVAPYEAHAESTLRAELNFSADQVLIGVVGRLTRWKGQHIVIEAAAQLLSKPAAKAVHFLVVGAPVFDSDTYQVWLHSLVRNKNLQAGVTFTGFRRDIANIMNGLDIVVVPSILPDPSPLVVLEAMACGKPVVGSRIGGIPESIVEGETGLLFSPGDSTELAQCLALLIDDAALRARLGSAGKSRVRALFTLSLYTQHVSDVFERVAG